MPPPRTGHSVKGAPASRPPPPPQHASSVPRIKAAAARPHLASHDRRYASVAPSRRPRCPHASREPRSRPEAGRHAGVPTRTGPAHEARGGRATPPPCAMNKYRLVHRSRRLRNGDVHPACHRMRRACMEPPYHTQQAAQPRWPPARCPHIRVPQGTRPHERLTLTARPPRPPPTSRAGDSGGGRPRPGGDVAGARAGRRVRRRTAPTEKGHRCEVEKKWGKVVGAAETRRRVQRRHCTARARRPPRVGPGGPRSYAWRSVTSTMADSAGGGTRAKEVDPMAT